MPGRRGLRNGAILAVLFATGGAAIVLQVTWQRLIALHSGVDLSSATTVVAVVLAGLGLGNLLGGRVADRLGQHDALAGLAVACAAVGAYAALSPWLLYDLHRAALTALTNPLVEIAFHGTVLAVPTLLLGSTLPLAATATTAGPGDAGRQVGRLQAMNTLGAAVGATIGGLYLVGKLGLDGTIRLVALIELSAAAVVVAVWRASPPAPAVDDLGEFVELGDLDDHGSWPRWVWYAIYATSGAVALGYEQVFFRLVDGALRSNAYTFGHVLAIYLVVWAAGAAAGSALVNRVHDQRRWLMWILFGAGAAALGSLVLVIDVLPEVILPDRFDRWFESTGLASGLAEADPIDLLLFGLVVPVAVMAAPVGLLGAAFPFAQSLVTRDLRHVGRATGRLQFANLSGNVAGALLASFVLIERLGTGGTYIVLAAPAVGAGLAAASLARSRPRALLSGGLVVIVSVALLLAAPDNRSVWARLHATTPDRMRLAEDRSCASAVELYGSTDRQLTINGAAQNNYPFDEFHVLIGLVPALAAPDGAGLAIGYGIGSTSYALLASERVEPVTSVELCGGNYALTATLADDGAPEMRRLHEDPRHRMVVGDGRRHLLTEESRYTVIVPDTVRPSSAGSNNVYSREFFELMRSRLAARGIVASWIATNRVINSATSVFPYVVRLEVGEYNSSAFLLASNTPLELDPVELVRRFDSLPPTTFPEPMRSSLRAYLASLRPECLNDGAVAPPPRSDAENRDLRPRDEYFLNQGAMSEDLITRTC